jgi:hypothetical protein
MIWIIMGAVVVGILLVLMYVYFKGKAEYERLLYLIEQAGKDAEIKF